MDQSCGWLKYCVMCCVWAEEPEPLAFSAMSMALTGVLTTVLVACPPVRAVLLTIALGSPA